MKMSGTRQVWLLPTLLMLLVVGFFAHLSIGKVPVDFITALANLFSDQQDPAILILQEIRFPRALLVILVGATLGISGAALQGLLRNPLAGPDLIGVTNCAALGAVITLYTGIAATAWYVLPLGGMAGAFLSVTMIFFLAGRQAGAINLILAGIAINALSSSLIALVLNFSHNPYAMNEIIYWLLGSVSNRSFNEIWIALPFMVTGWVVLLFSRNFLDALTLGEETAKTLGFHPVREQILLVIGVSLCTGAAVSVSGSIGFIGLVVPHLMRPLVGNEPGKLLAVSALAGAILLLAADSAVQLLSVHQELKLGVVTAMIGGPFFLMLVYRMRNEVY